jgi:hypothetical protein
MTTTAARGGRAAARDTSRQHAELTDALVDLEAALASPSYRRRPWWRRRVGRELETLIEALVAHRQSAEAPGGLYDELEARLGKTPMLRRGLQDHNRMEEAARNLIPTIRRRALGSDEEQARREAELLTRAVRRHQALEAELLLEAFNRDIGVGD